MTIVIVGLLVISLMAWQIFIKTNDKIEAKEVFKSSSLYQTLFSEKNMMVEYESEFLAYYHFPKVKNAFGNADVTKVHYFSKEEFHQIILSTVPEELRPKLSSYLSFVLKTAQKYQVDPFWLLAVMWTESHFENMSVSTRSAVGLMQILPQTGHFIAQNVLKKEVGHKEIKNYIREPYVNIELGAIYLKKLLKRFNNNYRLATVAYNMGPSRVLSRLNSGHSVGFRNEYMNKVKSSYEKISLNFISAIKVRNVYIDSIYVASN